MKRYFFIGMFLAPLFLLCSWGFKVLTAPGVTVTPEEHQEILEDINYTTEHTKYTLPAFAFHMQHKGAFTDEKLSVFKGKPSIIHLWATWCGPCKNELPEFSAFASKHKNKYNIVAISVDVDDSRDEAIKMVTGFWKDNKYTALPMVFDHKAMLARALGVSGVPTTIFLNEEGKEIGRINGVLSWSDPRIKLVIEKIFEQA